MAAADYSGKHAQVLRKVTKKGADAVFNVTGADVYVPETDSWAESADGTIAGKAVELRAEPEEYAAMELVAVEPAMLLFVPTTFGQLPGSGATIYWAGRTRTVHRTYPIRPAGVAIGARIAVK